MSFHHGELAAQQKAGLAEEAARLEGMARGTLPAGAGAFLAAQPMVVLGAADAAGRMWATMLTGTPGFIGVVGLSRLHVAARPGPRDPLHDALSRSTRVGMVAIEPGTRRRIRLNGTAHPGTGTDPGTDGVVVDLDEVYGNCPKYIQQREPDRAPSPATSARTGTALADDDAALVGAADTFFVATTDGASADASHRGGRPGFVEVVGPRHLRWPDYAGNAMFNSFGNLEVDPRAGLLVPDWRTGGLLHLSGTAVVDWDAAHARAVPGAERLVDLHVDHVVRVDGGSPLRWSEPVPSRFNPPTGRG